jgi:NADH-quinone oxidoreductase subunit A
LEQPGEYFGVLATLLFAVGVSIAVLVLNRLLGPKNKGSEVKSEAFECGMRPFVQPTGHFPVKFYLIAMLFILFDVEIVWFFPWAVVLREIGWLGIAEMFSFIAILILGFAYAWKKGALEWQK